MTDSTENIVGTRTCTRCNETKPATAEYFARSKRARRDGLASICRACRRAHYAANRESVAEYNHAYYAANRERVAAQVRDYVTANYEIVRSRSVVYYERQKARDGFNERRLQNSIAYRAQYPEKYRAHNAVNNAIRDGRLTKGTCVFCANPKTEAHHHDYSKPLDVIWVCSRCHKKEFHKMSATEA